MSRIKNMYTKHMKAVWLYWSSKENDNYKLPKSEKKVQQEYISYINFCKWMNYPYYNDITSFVREMNRAIQNEG